MSTTKNSAQVKRLKLETMIGYKMGATMKHLSGFMVTAKQKKSNKENALLHILES
jgi:hypothetical protein